MTETARTTGMRTFFIVWFGQLVSTLGTGLTRFGIAFWIFEETGSVTSLAVVILAGTIPGIVIGPFAGTFVDRLDRRTVMVVADSVAGATSIALAALWLTGSLEIWHIVLISAIGAVGESFQQPAYLASISLLVPKEQLGRANGLANANEAVSLVVSPILAGFLIAASGLGVVLIIDVVTFAVAVVTLLLVRFPRPGRRDADEGSPPFLQETMDGLRYLLARRGLFYFLLLAAVLNFILGFTNVLLFPLVLSFESAEAMGSVMSVIGLAMLGGSVIASTWRGPHRRMRFMLITIAVAGASLGMSGFRESVVWIAVWSIGLTLSVPIINATSQALWQSKVALDYQGRVFAIRRVIAVAASPIAYALAGPLADNVFEPLLADDGALAESIGQVIGTGPGRGIGLMYIIGGAALVVASLSGFAVHALRNVEDEIPDVL